MKLSEGTRVAAAITASFVAWTLAVMAQENSGGEARPPYENNSVNAPALTNAKSQALDNSLSTRADANAEEAKTGFSNTANRMTVRTANGAKTLNSKKHHPRPAESEDHSHDD